MAKTPHFEKAISDIAFQREVKTTSLESLRRVLEGEHVDPKEVPETRPGDFALIALELGATMSFDEHGVIVA